MSKSRRSSLLKLSITAALTLAAMTAAPAHSAASPKDEAVVRYTGGLWRGAIGDRIEVVFKERGADQTATGTLAKLDKFAMTLDVVVDGRSGKKVIVLGDVKSVKLVEAGATPGATSTAKAEDGAGKPSNEATSPTAEASVTPRRDDVSLVEHPDTAGPITGPRADGKKTVFVLPLPGTVGVGLRHEEMVKIEKEADKLGPGQIIVLRINSPGGYVVEGDRIFDVLTRIKKKHRLVSWIEEAISGGAFTALIADELYYMDVGSLGAITMYAGAESIKGAQLEAWLQKIFEVCEGGGRWGHVCRCMVYAEYELSYDFDPETGKVTWYDNMNGKYPLSDKKDNLSMNATDAVRSRFAQGRANTEYELFEAMQLEEGTYVVSDVGKKIANDWKRTQEQAHYEVPRLAREVQDPTVVGDPVTRLGARIQALKKIIAWWDRAPNVMMEMQAPPKERLQEQLKQLQKQLADAQRAKRERG